jgi:hypothetical protein
MLRVQTVRVAGIPVWIDASSLPVFALIAWNLVPGHVPYVLPDLTAAAARLHAMGAGLLLVSVFLMVSPTEALHTAVPAPLGPDDARVVGTWAAFFRTGRHRGRRDAVLDDGPESRVA